MKYMGNLKVGAMMYFEGYITKSEAALWTRIQSFFEGNMDEAKLTWPMYREYFCCCCCCCKKHSINRAGSIDQIRQVKKRTSEPNKQKNRARFRRTRNYDHIRKFVHIIISYYGQHIWTPSPPSVHRQTSSLPFECLFFGHF